jgi:UDP-N-acetylmuramoylalanine--D-glutamate ligase
MKHPRQYNGQEVVVLGLARSGAAVAKCFHRYGAIVTVNDKKERELCPEADELEALGISVICGGHPDSLVHPGVKLLVKNPGIPYHVQPIQQALRLDIEVVTEVEVAGQITRAPIIGITGSNGKTTTTTWTGRMLEAGGKSPIVAGNIGRPLTDAAEEADESQLLVAELSSFQLKGTVDFHPQIACLLNVSETHLDYHGSMEDYTASKLKLFANQTLEDYAVLNADDPVCRVVMSHAASRVIPFSLQQQLEYGVCLRHRSAERLEDGFLGAASERVKASELIYIDAEGFIHPIVPVRDIGLPGIFNVENAMAATAIAIASGVSIPDIAETLRTFRGVEHRLEFVAEHNGVQFYNNSKATNSAATIVALEALEKDIVLIAGGLDRGMEYDDLIPHLAERVKGVVALGETRAKIVSSAREAGIERVKSVDTATSAQEAVAEAVREAALLASPGDKVLLSPACASWDMFASFEERGRMFKESVHNL